MQDQHETTERNKDNQNKQKQHLQCKLGDGKMHKFQSLFKFVNQV